MSIKLALPTGDARSAVAGLLRECGLPTDGYDPPSRVLRAELAEVGLVYRIFREQDIPIQVALGNYDLGVCSLAWVLEHSIRFPRQQIVLLGSLAGGAAELWLAASPESGLAAGEVPAGEAGFGARIASEYGNLADWLALRLRWPRYELLPLYGSADAYPPEDAELVLLAASGEADVHGRGLLPLARVLDSRLVLVANRRALATRSLAPVLAKLSGRLQPVFPVLNVPRRWRTAPFSRAERRREVVRLALPDGHAQRHTHAALLEAGLQLEGYGEKEFVRRPRAPEAALEVKVIRPQDMPMLVARGHFDVAVTGVDWLKEHLARFPSSPVRMAVDLQRSRYRIGPVVAEEFPADSLDAALRIWRRWDRPVRIASEYPALAEEFARDFRLHFATIIPINGASEGFVPEDADILIEGSETGTSIRANGLKMLAPFLESTNCVIVRDPPVTERVDVLERLLARFASAGRVAAGV